MSTPVLPGWRDVWAAIRGLQRRSLQFRAIAITVALSAVTFIIIGVIITSSIARDLYSLNIDRVVEDTSRAASVAQQEFNAKRSDDSSQTLVGVQSTALDRAAQTATNSIGFAMYPTRQQSSPILLPGVSAREFNAANVSDELRTRLTTGTDPIVYQSVRLGGERDGHPGVVVGTLVTVNQTQYELYFEYDLIDAQKTLTFIQQTVGFAALALIILIAGIAWVVVRVVVDPIRRAAATAERLAEGQLEQRLRVQGDDVTATLARSFNRMADSLQDQIERLAELSRVQQQFVSDVSHELRTPLTTIRLAGGVIYDERDTFDPVTRRSAELLHGQVQRFELLLADLLEISRFDAGAALFTPTPTNLVDLVRGEIADLEPIARERGVDVRLIARGGFAEVEVDPTRVRRIVRNLLGNAIEHGERKPLLVTVDSDPRAVAVGVRDYGIGMKPEQTEHVFDRFWRADPSRQRTLGGTGLGLAISKEDAELHGGRIEVWSAEDLGTNFVLTLPRTPGASPGEGPLPVIPLDAGNSSPNDSTAQHRFTLPKPGDPPPPGIRPGSAPTRDAGTLRTDETDEGGRR